MSLRNSFGSNCFLSRCFYSRMFCCSCFAWLLSKPIGCLLLMAWTLNLSAAEEMPGGPKDFIVIKLTKFLTLISYYPWPLISILCWCSTSLYFWSLVFKAIILSWTTGLYLCKIMGPWISTSVYETVLSLTFLMGSAGCCLLLKKDEYGFDWKLNKELRLPFLWSDIKLPLVSWTFGFGLEFSVLTFLLLGVAHAAFITDCACE